MSLRPQALYCALLSTVAAYLAASTFGPACAGGVFAVALLVFILLTVTGGGRIALRCFGAGDLSESEKTLIGATLGIGLLSQCVFLLGILGWLHPWTLTALMGVFWVIGFTEMPDVIRSLGANANLLRERPLATGGVLGVLAVLLWMTFIPPHQYDALVYHLPLAAAYAREGKIFAVEHLLFTHFPQNAEMLYTLALLLGSDSLAQMFTWLGAFLSAWWIFEMGKREVPTTVALLACFLTTTHTAVMLLAPTAYVECLVMLWITASVLSFLRWRGRAQVENYPRGWLALSGVFAGFGVGTKYTAGITPILLGTYLIGRWARARWGRRSESGTALDRMKDAAFFGGAAASAAAPWLLKNAVFVGNPVFPFLYRALPPRGVDWNAQSAQRYFEIMTEYGQHAGTFFSDFLKFPFLVLLSPQKFGGGMDVLGDYGWALIFLALPAAVWAGWKNRYLRWMLAYCAGHWAIWYGTGVVLRFLVPLVPILSLLTAHGLYKLREVCGRSSRALLAAGVAAIIFLNLGFFLYTHAVVDSLSVLVGLKSRQQHLSQLLDYYACANYARESVSPAEKILIAGEQRGYYVVQPHVATTVMAPNRFVRAANEAASAEDLGRRLKTESGFSHLMIVPREAHRLEDYGIFHFTEEGGARWAQWEKSRLELEYESKGRCALYRIH